MPWLPQRVKWLAPEIKTSLLFGDTAWPRMLAWARSVDADYVHPCWEKCSPQPHALLTSEFLAATQEAGFRIVLWHEERTQELVELVRFPVDGICTNTPDRLRAILHPAPSARGR